MSGWSNPNCARSCSRTAGVMRGESNANGSPGIARTTKKVIVVTMKTTMIDCPSRVARRRRTLPPRCVRSHRVAVDALVRRDRPLGERAPPAVGTDRAHGDTAVHRVDAAQIVEPDGRRIVDDLLIRARRVLSDLGRI